MSGAATVVYQFLLGPASETTKPRRLRNSTKPCANKREAKKSLAQQLSSWKLPWRSQPVLPVCLPPPVAQWFYLPPNAPKSSPLPTPRSSATHHTLSSSPPPPPPPSCIPHLFHISFRGLVAFRLPTAFLPGSFNLASRQLLVESTLRLSPIPICIGHVPANCQLFRSHRNASAPTLPTKIFFHGRSRTTWKKTLFFPSPETRLFSSFLDSMQ